MCTICVYIIYIYMYGIIWVGSLLRQLLDDYNRRCSIAEAVASFDCIAVRSSRQRLAWEKNQCHAINPAVSDFCLHAFVKKIEYCKDLMLYQCLSYQWPFQEPKFQVHTIYIYIYIYIYGLKKRPKFQGTSPQNIAILGSWNSHWS